MAAQTIFSRVCLHAWRYLVCICKNTPLFCFTSEEADREAKQIFLTTHCSKRLNNLKDLFWALGMCSHVMPTNKPTEQGIQGNKLQQTMWEQSAPDLAHGHSGQVGVASGGFCWELGLRVSARREGSVSGVSYGQEWKTVQTWGSWPALQKVVKESLVQESRGLNSSPSNATQSLTDLGHATLPIHFPGFVTISQMRIQLCGLHGPMQN